MLKIFVYLNLWSSLFAKVPVYGFPVLKGFKIHGITLFTTEIFLDQIFHKYSLLLLLVSVCLCIMCHQHLRPYGDGKLLVREIG